MYLSFALQVVSDFFYFLCSIAIMKWTLETEEMLLQLYVEVKTVYNNKMKRDTEKYRWIAKKLAEADVDVTWKQVKDKLQAVKKTGNKKLREFVMPLIRRKESTGSAVDDDQLDWGDLVKRSKWPLLEIYYRIFKSHPTLGLAFGADTGDSASESECSKEDTVTETLDNRIGEVDLTSLAEVEVNGSEASASEQSESDNDMTNDDSEEDSDDPVTPPPHLPVQPVTPPPPPPHPRLVQSAPQQPA